jgi:sn-glycerol 3-phosphate transport system permease protein
MVERRRFGNLLPHAILLLGVFIVVFPVYLAVVGSTHDAATIANGMRLTPGTHTFENYYRTLFEGASKTAREPVSTMLFNSFVVAIVIALGKIAISIISAYAIVYFQFPFRMAAFWMIFITLMLPVEVRIYPTTRPWPISASSTPIPGSPCPSSRPRPRRSSSGSSS